MQPARFTTISASKILTLIQTRRRRVFKTTGCETSNVEIPSFIIKAFLIIRALSIACYVAASASTAIDVT